MNIAQEVGHRRLEGAVHGKLGVEILEDAHDLVERCVLLADRARFEAA